MFLCVIDGVSSPPAVLGQIADAHAAVVYQMAVTPVHTARTLDWLKKNKNITMLTLEKLCTIIDCTPNDIVQFTQES